MKKLIRYGTVVIFLASSVWAASVLGASAGELKLTIGNGRATLVAHEVPLRQILAEWERVGRTTIINGDKMTGPAVTLQLMDRPEREVLEVILRSASGYVVASRPSEIAGASMFDRVMILATSRGPVGLAAAPPAAFSNRTPPPQPMPMPMPMTDDDDDEPVESPNASPNSPNGFPNSPNQPGLLPNPGQLGNIPAQSVPGQQLTAPRPGMLPAPPAGQPNPYAPAPQPAGVRPPGRPGGGSGEST